MPRDEKDEDVFLEPGDLVKKRQGLMPFRVFRVNEVGSLIPLDDLETSLVSLLDE